MRPASDMVQGCSTVYTLERVNAPWFCIQHANQQKLDSVLKTRDHTYFQHQN